MGITELPFDKYTRGKGFKVKEYTLPEPLFVCSENGFACWTIPTGTVIKLITSANFGYVMTPDLGNARRLFRY